MNLNKKQQKELKKRFGKIVGNWKGHPDFPYILMDMLQLHNDKSNDYANEESPFANIEMCEKGDLPAWKGVVVRLGDKYSRLLNAMAGKLFKFEGVKDAFLDNAVYSIIGLIEYVKAKKEEKKNK